MKKILSLFLILLMILLPMKSLTEQAKPDSDFDTARAIANFMETHYDVTVLIGPECENVTTPDYFTLGDHPKGRTPFLDMLGGHSYTNEIQRIDDTLSVYPPEFFSKFQCEYAPKGIRIILALQIIYKDTSVAGVTTVEDGYINIFLGVGSFIDLNIHHEMWHAMEFRILAEDPHAFDNWSTLNPEDFEYSDDHFALDPWEQVETQEDWFARGYSTIADYEDRATTIEALFRHDPDWWATRPHLQKKLDFLIETAEPIFGNVYFYE